MSLKVLISQPNLYDSKVFMPLVFLCLKTYVDKRTDVNPVTWLDPLFRNTDCATMLKDVDTKNLDILGLSCYDWNWSLQLQIAKQVKEDNPDVLVVAGGPHPDWKNKDFFKKYPEIDIVVYNDGERPFAEIIKAVQNGTNFDKIDNLIMPHLRTPPSELFKEFDASPWLENKQWVIDFKKKHIDNGKNKQFTLLWETDRGCPFKCAFCDWGSATNSKVRRFSDERIRQEIDFFTEELGVDVLYHVGANLGIFPRDLEFVKYICQKKKETGFPKTFQYSTSKNTPERTVSIAKELYESKLLRKHVVSLQHTHQKVLDCIDRYNIPVKRQIPMVQELNKARMPCISQMIMGMPGDTPDLWMKALTDTIEWGIHFECRIYDFQLLPNAPAAQKDYMEKWQIETRTKHFINGYHKMLEQDHASPPSNSEFIVATSTYTLEDWLQMKVFGKMFMALHGGSVTKWTSMFCRNTLGVTYYDFYKDLYNDFFKNTKYPYTKSIYDKGYAHFKNFIDDENSTDELQIENLKNSRYYQLEEYILWNCLYDENFEHNKIFWKELQSYMDEKYKNEEIKDLIKFNMNMILDHSYNPEIGKEIKCNRDWIAYIDKCTWNSVDNTSTDFDTLSNLIELPVKFNQTKTWKTTDRKLGQFPMGPNQDVDWGNDKQSFADHVLAPTYMRGTRTVYNRGEYV